MLFFRKYIQGLGCTAEPETTDSTEKHPLYYTTSMRGCTVQIAGSGVFLAVLRPLPTNLRAKLYGWAEQCVRSTGRDRPGVICCPVHSGRAAAEV